MATKHLPLSASRLEELAQEFETPFYLYDEKAIRENARRINSAFAWNAGFKEFFAVKATPNPYLISLLKAEGFGADCSSLPELMLADKSGVESEDIMFTSNDTPAAEYCKARELGAVINLDDISHVPFLAEHAGMPDMICLRYNPGPLKEGNAIIGHPEEAKYGFTREQLFAGYRQAAEMGATRFGIHAMVASNELDRSYFVETAHILFELIVEISRQLKIRFEFVNIGGGIGIPYRPEEDAVNLESVSKGIKAVYDSTIVPAGLDPLKLYLECGRVITGPYGYLVSRVLHIKQTYKNFAGVDACMANLMRPALYGAYHHITVANRQDAACDTMYDVTGSLCENNDKFAIDRMLPELSPGDLVVLHDAGAHGHAMGFNYNGKLRCAEYLLRENGEIAMIRRAETVDDLFATIDMDGLSSFAV